MSTEHLHYPFSAIVGQEDMKAALILNAVDPSIGGVLIQGEKGTAKTTAVRALARVLHETEDIVSLPYTETIGLEQHHKSLEIRANRCVELPLNASEDRLLGSLHLGKALNKGLMEFEPGLLARAHTGILYIDEVNLLEGHLVDVLLDAAATGVVRIEQEGISVSHPSRFMLIGTMNPEEGDLRPQLLDRFGLSVAILGINSLRWRQEIVDRRLAFEQDPAGFVQDYRQQDLGLLELIEAARKRLNSVEIGGAAREAAISLCLEAGVVGHRADIVLIKTARALAAFTAKPAVGLVEIRAAAPLALLHRIEGAANPLDARQRIESVLGENEDGLTGSGRDAAQDPDHDLEYTEDHSFVPGGAAAGSLLMEALKKKVMSPCSGTSMP